MPQTGQYRRVGKFELHELIGEGAMGTVWKAYDSVIRRYVALKLLSRAGRPTDAQERFMREARAAGALQHPNIVTIYDLGESDDQLYMAPEQITNGAITPATDIFAVGCLLYELLAYHKPFTGETVHGVLYQVLTTDPKALRTMAPSIPASLERVVGKALNKVPEERYETARQMQSALFSIRAALSGASDTTERLSLRWTPIPSAVLRLVTHAPIKWRAAVLTALMVMALVLLYVSRSPSPVAAPFPDAELTGATLDQLVGYPVPAHLNAALVAQRDSALAARERARHAGAMKNNVPSLILAEAVVQNAERAVRTGDLARAASGYLGAIPQYAKAQAEAETLRREAEQAIARATPVVHALATPPQAGAAPNLPPAGGPAPQAP